MSGQKYFVTSGGTLGTNVNFRSAELGSEATQTGAYTEKTRTFSQVRLNKNTLLFGT